MFLKSDKDRTDLEEWSKINKEAANLIYCMLLENDYL